MSSTPSSKSKPNPLAHFRTIAPANHRMPTTNPNGAGFSSSLTTVPVNPTLAPVYQNHQTHQAPPSTSTHFNHSSIVTMDRSYSSQVTCSPPYFDETAKNAYGELLAINPYEGVHDMQSMKRKIYDIFENFNHPLTYIKQQSSDPEIHQIIDKARRAFNHATNIIQNNNCLIDVPKYTSDILTNALTVNPLQKLTASFKLVAMAIISTILTDPAQLNQQHADVYGFLLQSTSIHHHTRKLREYLNQLIDENITPTYYENANKAFKIAASHLCLELEYNCLLNLEAINIHSFLESISSHAQPMIEHVTKSFIPLNQAQNWDDEAIFQQMNNYSQNRFAEEYTTAQTLAQDFQALTEKFT